jgi:hypothetical protein
MRAADVENTGSCTPYGNFHFKVMPMGLCGAPSTSQYLMHEVFRKDLLRGNSTVPYWIFTAAYLDDICIAVLCCSACANTLSMSNLPNVPGVKVRLSF